MAFRRKQIGHQPPNWVGDGEVFFITICLKDRGSRQLLEPEVASMVKESVSFYQEQGRWWVELFLLMPDHLHALISFNQREYPMSESIRTWKSYLKRHCGVMWQRGYFDHRLRTADHLREKAMYIRLNPVRAGLVQCAEDWEYLWTSEGRVFH